MVEMLELRDAGKLNKTQMQWFQTNGKEELYDCEADSHNVHNLTGKSQYAVTLRKMQQQLQYHTDENIDFGMLNEATLIDNFWANNYQPKAEKPIIKCQKNRVMLSCPMNATSIGYCISDKERIDNPLAEKWSLWHQPFSIPKGKYLHVIAERIGYQTSEIMTKKF